MLSPDATRLITVADNTLTIWDVQTREPVGRIETQTGFELPPAIGVDSEYIAIAERLDDPRLRLSEPAPDVNVSGLWRPPLFQSDV